MAQSWFGDSSRLMVEWDAGVLINGKGIKETGLINHLYKLLIVDIDGTLVCKDGTISARG